MRTPWPRRFVVRNPDRALLWGMHHPMKYILTKEAARLLDLTPNTVRLLERRGELSAERAGSVRLFDRRVVERVARKRAKRARAQEAA